MPRRLGWGGVFATDGLRNFSGKAVAVAATPVVSRSVGLDSNPSDSLTLDSNPSDTLTLDS